MKGMKFEISPFTIDAFDSVLTLWQQSEGVGLSEDDSRERISIYVERNVGTSFVATSNGCVVGAVLAGHDGRRGYLHHLAVHPQWRRRAIGRKLVARCLAALHNLGIRKCHIFIFDRNQDGVAFWKSVGWTPRTDLGMMSKNIEGDAVTNEAERSEPDALF